jgi:hypothetical protein
MRKPIHTKLYNSKRRKASNKQIKEDFFHDHLRHLKLKKIKDMGKLLKGTIRQLPTESANQYVLRFRTQVGEADCGNYASDSRLNTILCYYFREGLLPHLRKYAHSDDKAQPFVDLDRLITHIYGKEDEYVEMQSGDTTGRLAYYSDSYHPRTRPQGLNPAATNSRGGYGGRGRGRLPHTAMGYGGGRGGPPSGYGGSYGAGGGGWGAVGGLPLPPGRGGRGTRGGPGRGRGSAAYPHQGRQEGNPPRQEGSMRDRAIAVMCPIYTQRHGGKWEDSDLSKWYNHYNKTSMCPICETDAHSVQQCAHLPPPRYQEDD